jgi:hypothetical protein
LYELVAPHLTEKQRRLLDPLVDGVVVDAEHPRGLGLGHAGQHRSDGPVTQRRLRRGGQ